MPARRAYLLRAVVDHNRAQFELQRAQGWPVNGSLINEGVL